MKVMIPEYLLDKYPDKCRLVQGIFEAMEVNEDFETKCSEVMIQDSEGKHNGTILIGDEEDTGKVILELHFGLNETDFIQAVSSVIGMLVIKGRSYDTAAYAIKEGMQYASEITRFCLLEGTNMCKYANEIRKNFTVNELAKALQVVSDTMDMASDLPDWSASCEGFSDAKRTINRLLLMALKNI